MDSMAQITASEDSQGSFASCFSKNPPMWTVACGLSKLLRGTGHATLVLIDHQKDSSHRTRGSVSAMESEVRQKECRLQTERQPLQKKTHCKHNSSCSSRHNETDNTVATSLKCLEYSNHRKSRSRNPFDTLTSAFCNIFHNLSS